MHLQPVLGRDAHYLAVSSPGCPPSVSWKAVCSAPHAPRPRDQLSSGTFSPQWAPSSHHSPEGCSPAMKQPQQAHGPDFSVCTKQPLGHSEGRRGCPESIESEREENQASLYPAIPLRLWTHSRKGGPHTPSLNTGELYLMLHLQSGLLPCPPRTFSLLPQNQSCDLEANPALSQSVDQVCRAQDSWVMPGLVRSPGTPHGRGLL